jgi:hypothetical protein
VGIFEATSSPSKVTITNIGAAETLAVQMNPETIEETVNVNYEALSILGLSHQPLQYQNTENHKLPLKLPFDALHSSKTDIMDARSFLLALCYSRTGAQTVLGGAPPRALVVWPSFFSLTCAVRSLKIEHMRFNLKGRPTYYVATLGLEEIRDFRLLSEDVRRDGTFR